MSAHTNKLELRFLAQPGATKARTGVQVKRLASEEDICVLAQSDAKARRSRASHC